MLIQPIPPADFTSGFSRLRVPPSSSGTGTRQSAIPSERVAVHTRNMMRWMLPESGIIDMYINPENVSYNDSKLITNARTKGGYTLQYWGEELGNIRLSGTTGSSGVEGINVLYDIYRSEQIAFDPYALAFASALDRAQGRETVLGDYPGSILDVFGTGIGNTFSEQIVNSLEYGTTNPTRPRPTLASLAFSVELYWSGWVFRGYFKDFSLEENAQKLGLFNYTMNFVYTQKRGYRFNFMPWHRSPTTGPSNSDPVLGVPYSYADEMYSNSNGTSGQTTERTISTNNRLISSTGYIGDKVR